MHLIVNLPYAIFWIAAVVFLIASSLLSYSLIRSQRKSIDDMETEQTLHSNRILETIWTLIPIGILVVLLILTYQTMQLAE